MVSIFVRCNRSCRASYVVRYRHMIVAPGKLKVMADQMCSKKPLIFFVKGYGATTFPTLTEAITIEHNATLATLEMERLVQLLRTLAQKLDKND